MYEKSRREADLYWRSAIGKIPCKGDIKYNKFFIVFANLNATSSLWDTYGYFGYSKI